MMFFEMFRMWIGVAKAHVMWIGLFALCSIILWQHHSIGSLKEDMAVYQANAARAEAEQADCEKAYKESDVNYQLLLEYYKARKPLELKEGPVMPGIFDDLVSPKGQPSK